MAKLDVFRMSNSTKLGRVDDVHVELEGDLEAIFGIPDNTIITSPIFGRTHDGRTSIDSAGQIRGVPRFIMDAATSNPASAVGLEFSDGIETKRILFVNSGLKIYRQGDSAWELVADLEEPGSGSGLLTSLSDVDPDMVMADNKVLAWNDTEEFFELVDPASGEGISEFVELTDTPADYGATNFDPAKVGHLVNIASVDSLGFVEPPSGLGLPFAMFLQSPIGINDDPTISSEWIRDTSWLDAYNWEYKTFNDDGDWLTDNALFLTNDGALANKFITLNAGVYQINFWYNSFGGDVYGTREWRVAGTYAEGAATLGINRHANLYWNSAQPDPTLNPMALPGMHHLGSQMLMMISDGTIKFQIRQSSPWNMQGVQFFATIIGVK